MAAELCNVLCKPAGERSCSGVGPSWDPTFLEATPPLSAVDIGVGGKAADCKSIGDSVASFCIAECNGDRSELGVPALDADLVGDNDLARSSMHPQLVNTSSSRHDSDALSMFVD